MGNIDVTLLMDRSGSMSSILQDTLGGINTYWSELRSSPNAESMRATMITFDSTSRDVVFEGLNLKDVPTITRAHLTPRDRTPLLEAAIVTIENLARLLPSGDRAFLVIVTDGEENASGREYTRERLSTLIAEKRAVGWEFVFLGAGFDNYGESAKIGVGKINTVSYDAKDIGATRAAYASAAGATECHLEGNFTGFTAEQKLRAGDRFAYDGKDYSPEALKGFPASDENGDLVDYSKAST